jgi:hypothetical protein
MNSKVLNCLFFMFICLNFINCDSLINLQADTHMITSAVVETIDKLYIQAFRQFKVRIYGEFTSRLRDVIDAVGKRISDRTPLIIEHSQKMNRKTCKFAQSTVILTSKVETLNKINKLATLTNQGERSLRFIVYCEHWDKHVIEKPKFNWMHLLSGHITLHEYFIVHKIDSIDLMTFKSFSEQVCYQPQLALRDKFNTVTEKWILKLKVAENGKQFYNCKIYTLINAVTEGYFWKNKTTLEMGGIFVEVHKIMAQVGNFTPSYLKMYRDTVLMEEKYPIDVYFPYKITKITNADLFVQLFFSREFHFALTPNEQYTNYEKILFPFDVASWILFGVFFGMTLAAIAVINRQPRETRVVFFGAGIKVPTYNAVGAFFGIGQKRLPSENCPRILLTFFIYLCLIFRTCYQGRMFDFMTSDMRKPSPETLDELYDRGYTIYADSNLSQFRNSDKM